MKRKHGFFFGFAVLLLAAMFTVAGCDNPADSPTDNPADDKADSKLAAPIGVKAVALSSTAVRVTWNSVSEATGYYVWRSVGGSGIIKVGSAQYLGYTDTQTDFISGYTYFYEVQAYNSEKEGAFSDAAYVTIP
jgi:hypothetical protein